MEEHSLIDGKWSALSTLDAHVHLDFMSNGEEVAADAERAGVRLLAATVTPAGFVAARKRFDGASAVTVGVGMHPWWVESAGDADELIKHLDETPLVSEVGLDFGKRYRAMRDVQEQVFSRIVHACAEAGDKTLSIHSIHAAREALDILEGSDVFQTCTCVFHWYSGPSDQLKRAIDNGCYFSVNERMLATGKGLEYAKAIPAKRLLLETDDPPQQGQKYSFATLKASLDRAFEGVARAKEGSAGNRRSKSS